MIAATPDPDDVAAFRAAVAVVRGRIAGACVRARRDPSGVELVAVSKTVPPERIVAAVAAGIAVLGENRVQEAAGKIPQIRGASWHLVGHLQRNKAGAAIRLFDTIESADSAELAQRLDRLAGEALAAGDRLPWAIGGDGPVALVASGRAGQPPDHAGMPPAGPPAARPRLPVLLQVNVDADPAKEGFTPDAIERELPGLAGLRHLALEGLMTVGHLTATAEEARPTFVALRRLSERLRSREPRLGPALSMGMTGDYEVAIEEGATIVRVGRAIFGERPHG